MLCAHCQVKEAKVKFCSLACTKASQTKKYSKELLTDLLLRTRNGTYPNWIGIARKLGLKRTENIKKRARKLNLIDKHNNGPIINGEYLSIPEDADRYSPINPQLVSKEHLEKRLLNRCEKDEKTGCWIWVGAWDKNGYGIFSMPRPYKSCSTHVIAAYIWKNEPLPTKKIIFRKCNSRACFNPEHLIVCKNRKALVKLMIKYGKNCKGETVWASKINLATALDIRDALIANEENHHQIAERLSITDQIVHHIARRRTWKHIWKIKHEYVNLA